MCWGTERNKKQTRKKKQTQAKIKGRALHWPNELKRAVNVSK